MKKLQLFFAAVPFQIFGRCRFKFFGLVGLTAFLAAPAGAASSYTVDTTGNCWTGTHMIAAADSGMTSSHYALSVYNGAIAPANRVSRSLYSASVDTGNYNLSITFSAGNWPSNFCGHIVLRGVFAASDTANGIDFKPYAYPATVPNANSPAAVVIAYSGFSGLSQRTYGGVTYAQDVNGVAGVASDGSCTGDVYGYLTGAEGKLVFAHSASAACLISPGWGSKATLASGSGYPSGSVALGTWHVTYSGSTPTLTLTSDDRPWKP
jgi:hypothetical protein